MSSTAGHEGSAWSARCRRQLLGKVFAGIQKLEEAANCVEVVGRLDLAGQFYGAAGKQKYPAAEVAIKQGRHL